MWKIQGEQLADPGLGKKGSKSCSDQDNDNSQQDSFMGTRNEPCHAAFI